MTAIWYNKGLSSTADAIAMMRADPAAGDLTFVASHADAANLVREVADTFVQEPLGLLRDAYADWALDCAIRHGIALMVVQRHATALWEARPRFEAQGIRLQIAAAPGVRALLDDKIAFQTDIAAAGAGGAAGHAVHPFTTLPEFDDAWTAMTAAGQAQDGLCAKPATGIFGTGFRRIEPDADEMARLLSSDPDAGFRISLAAYRAALAGAAAPVRQMLMPYLPGLERSVDFVANDGELLSAVVRVKTARVQRLETSGPSVDMTRALAARYRLTGLCNLQTREDGAGREAVLEINPRMSGGMALACLAGVNLPLMAVWAGLGRDLSGFAAPVGGASVRFRQVAGIVPD